MKPKFAPGKKAQYSDTNYQLLGRIIEMVTKKDIHTVFKEFIFDELKLENTYLYEDVNDNRPAPIYYKDKEIYLPKYMSSIGPEGGIVSTAKEFMIFLKAFFNGHFFPKEDFDELKEWKLFLVQDYSFMVSGLQVSLYRLKN